MSDAIKYMIRQGYEDNPRIAPGDIFTNNDAMIGDVHNADVQTIVPIFWEDELVGWGRGDARDRHRREDAGLGPVGPIARYEDGIDLPAKKIGSNDELWRDHVLAGLKGTRTPMYWTLDEKTRIAGCHMVRESVERVILEEGIDSYKRFIREVIEDGRRSFQSRVREMLIPGVTAPAFTENAFAKEEQLPSYARRHDDARADRDPRHARREAGDGLRGRVVVGIPLLELHAVGDAGCGVQLTQTLIPNDKVNDGAYLGLNTNFRPGRGRNHSNPQASTGIAWAFLIPSFMGFIKSVSRALQARGFVEEVLAPYGLTSNAFQGARIDQYGKQSATTNFGLSCVGGGKMILDGLDYAAAMWNPEGDMGDMEMWELIEPFLYIGQRVKPNTAGPAPSRRLGLRGAAARLEDAVLRDEDHRQRRMFIQTGLCTPPRPGTGTTRNTNFFDLVDRREPFPTHDPDPADSALERMVEVSASSTSRPPPCPR